MNLSILAFDLCADFVSIGRRWLIGWLGRDCLRGLNILVKFGLLWCFVGRCGLSGGFSLFDWFLECLGICRGLTLFGCLGRCFLRSLSFRRHLVLLRSFGRLRCFGLRRYLLRGIGFCGCLNLLRSFLR
ncbi:hypothetical protein CDD83_1886 [Cordyceps sp. RAO-2017]|nr:hypothetical protein CDD83_1886 [Cordyceps sp. RAO-2017]